LVYLLILIRKKVHKTAFISGILALVVMAPYLIYCIKNFTTIGMNSAEVQTFQNALDIVKNGNPHLDEHLWLNGLGLFKIALMIVAAIFLRKTKLFLPFVFLLSISFLLSLIALVFGNSFLINLAPWRMSVVVVPVSTLVLLYAFTEKLPRPASVLAVIISIAAVATIFYRIFGEAEILPQWRIATLAAAITASLFAFFVLSKRKFWQVYFSTTLIMILVLCGIITMIFEHKYEAQKPEKGAVAFAREHSEKGDLYLVPPELTDFRLEAGVPVYVDDNLYFSTKMADWLKRRDIADAFYRQQNQLCGESQISKIVIPVSSKINCENWKEIYRDEHYIISGR